jgi:hypothetical protein
MRKFVYSTWGAADKYIECDEVQFTQHHVLFLRDAPNIVPFIIRAEHHEYVRRLEEVEPE